MEQKILKGDESYDALARKHLRAGLKGLDVEKKNLDALKETEKADQIRFKAARSKKRALVLLAAKTMKIAAQAKALYRKRGAKSRVLRARVKRLTRKSATVKQAYSISAKK